MTRQLTPPGDDVLVYPIRNSLYVNLGDRCTLTCQFCPKTHGQVQVHDYDLRLHERPVPERIIALIGDPRDYEEIVFCGYGEPTLRLKALLQIAHWVKQAGGRVRVNTDGLGNRVNKRDILPELATCVDALSISLNAHTAELYERHCQPALPGSFESVLAFIELAVGQIAEVTVTAIDGLEEVDIEACRQLAEARGAAFRCRMLDVVG